jgi:hypothetical protein
MASHLLMVIVPGSHCETGETEQGLRMDDHARNELAQPNVESF